VGIPATGTDNTRGNFKDRQHADFFKLMIVLIVYIMEVPSRLIFILNSLAQQSLQRGRLILVARSVIELRLGTEMVTCVWCRSMEWMFLL